MLAVGLAILALASGSLRAQTPVVAAGPVVAGPIAADGAILSSGPGVIAGPVPGWSIGPPPLMAKAGLGSPPCSNCEPECAKKDWPVLYFETDTILMSRNNDTLNRPLISAAAPLLTTQDLNFDLGFGPRFTLGYHTGPCYGWEATAFGIYGMQDTATVTGPGNLSLAGPIAAAADDFAGANAMRVDLSTDINNIEFNGLRSFGPIYLMAGLRFFDFDETMNINTTDSDGSISDFKIHSRNHLIGMQFGARVVRNSELWAWSATGKAGLYSNDASESQFLQNDNNTVLIRNTNFNKVNGAFLGELNLVGTYKLSPFWYLKSGYNFIWLEDMALAGNQVDFSNTPLSGTSLNRHGRVLLNGMTFGVEARW